MHVAGEPSTLCNFEHEDDKSDCQEVIKILRNKIAKVVSKSGSMVEAYGTDAISRGASTCKQLSGKYANDCNKVVEEATETISELKESKNDPPGLEEEPSESEDSEEIVGASEATGATGATGATFSGAATQELPENDSEDQLSEDDSEDDDSEEKQYENGVAGASKVVGTRFAQVQTPVRRPVQGKIILLGPTILMKQQLQTVRKVLQRVTFFAKQLPAGNVTTLMKLNLMRTMVRANRQMRVLQRNMDVLEFSSKRLFQGKPNAYQMTLVRTMNRMKRRLQVLRIRARRTRLGIGKKLAEGNGLEKMNVIRALGSIQAGVFNLWTMTTKAEWLIEGL
jgi:hypothetical protein